MATLSTHILDTSVGLPAATVQVFCDTQTPNGWKRISEGVTDEDGRVKGLQGDHPLIEGETYRLTFHTAPYFHRRGIATFYPLVEVQFVVGGDRDHYHVPLLLNAFGYSTYRGS